ncbi:hypothetical protein HID58_048276 [Brassica napus]|uniref:Uncharacterized protein n=1 Tax=Brassica napus TaxID=3708 RepID=A0ABQ8B1Z4_BRANA|nr:hypothetical protein HID58_048276 [Brassica napus]
MSFNVQAAPCFPMGEPLSAFSGRHSMTRRLFLNLLCHGHVDGKVYQGTWPGKAVVRWSEPWIRNLEAGIRNLEPRGGRAAVFPALGHVFRGTPLLAPPAFGIRQNCKPGRRCYALLGDLLSFSYVAEL